MPNERFTRGPAVSDGIEVPSRRAELVIFLKNEATGETTVWQRKDDPRDDYVSWLATLLGWGQKG